MKIQKIETNVRRKYFLHKTENLTLSTIDHPIESNKININPDYKYQKIIGFGGAFTESTGYAINQTKTETAKKIIEEYFSSRGLNYTLCRLPIGSCDFSLKSYSYSNKKDLLDFTINKDKNYILPTIKLAQQQNKNIKFLSSPWSPPAFMKDNNNLYHGGKLLKEYKNKWAEYLVKYVKAYQVEGINIDYMTIQNEPNATQTWESCRYTAQEEADLLRHYLFPTFKQNNLNTKFLIWDHNKDSLLERTIDCLIANGALEYVAGIAFHWYTGSHFQNLNLIHSLFPDKLLIHTEGCTGYSKFKPKDELFNAEMYAKEIIGDLNNGVNGFIDWNMVLQYNGGPNHKQNYCNSPIMINKNNSDYIKTPAFYYIGHFSKYIKPHSQRIHLSTFTEDILATAFKNDDNSLVVVLFNKNNFNIEYNFCYQNYVFHDNLDSHAIVTLIINGV